MPERYLEAPVTYQTNSEMGLFEFLMVLVSVVIGLALSEILTGAANLLRSRETIRFYWIHILFQIALFFALFQQWWESWDLRTVPELSFLAVLTLLSSPIFLFLMAHLLYPRPSKDADLKVYYFRQAPLLWWLVVAGTVIGTFVKPLSLDFSIFQFDNLSGIPTIAICIVLAISKKPLVHKIFAPLILGILIFDTILAGSVISAG